MTAPSLTAFIQGQGACSADNLNTFVQSCDTVSQLREFIGLPGIQVYVRGISAPNDGGQGAFYWQVVVTEPDDNLNYIVPPGSATGGWVRLGPTTRNYFYSATQQSPVGTASLSDFVMMGLGSIWVLTPVLTGNVRVQVTGWTNNSSASGVANLDINYGTGVAPTNGATEVGARVGAPIRNPGSAAAFVGCSFSYYAEISSLLVGTPYWFDVALQSGLGGTSTVNVCTILIEEF